jgi:hypothetical protein
MLKPQDVLVALALAAGGPLRFEALAKLTGQAISQTHASVKRLEKSRLVNADRSVNRPNLAEFLIHGVRYLLPPVSLGVLTGMPTAGAAPALQSMSFPMPDAAPWVWPADDGDVRGIGLEPICASAPVAAKNHEGLYRLLALVDALRVGAARDRQLAAAALRKDLGLDG